MLIPKKNRKLIYEKLFSAGVLVAEKDFIGVHKSMDVPNLQVIKAMQSLVSKHLVTEKFCWRHYYWYLDNNGMSYLREYLNLSSDVVPSTLRRSTKTEVSSRPKGMEGGRGARTEGDREQYRRADGDKVPTAGTAQPRFVSAPYLVTANLNRLVRVPFVVV